MKWRRPATHSPRRHSLRTTTPRLEVLEERRLLSATPQSPLAEPLVLTGGAEFQVNTTTLYDQKLPEVTRFADGSFAVQWLTKSDEFALQRYSSTGVAVGSEVFVDNGVVEALAVAADGTSVGVFTIQNYVVGYRFDALGNQIGNYFHVKETPGTATDARVFTDAAGNTAFLWRGGENAPNRLFVRWYDAGGSPLGDAYAVGDVTSSNAFYDAAMNPAGELAITFGVNQYPGSWQARVIRLNGTIVGPVIVYGSDQVQSIAISPSGEFAVRYGGGKLVQRYDATGQPLGDVIDTGLSYTWRQMSMDPGGDLILVGQRSGPSYEPGGSGWGVVARTYKTDGSLETSLFPVNTTLAGNQQFPSVASLNGADFVIAWQSQGQDGSLEGIFARRFVRDDLPTVDNVVAAWGSPLADGETSFSELPGLRVTFSRPMNAGLVTSPSQWQLLEGGIDVSSRIANIEYADEVAYVTFTEPLRGTGYELIVQDAVQDTLGRALDGDADETAGGDFSFTFSVRQGIVGIGPEHVIFGNASTVMAINEEGGFAVSDTVFQYLVPPRTEVRIFDSAGQTLFPFVSFSEYWTYGLIPLEGGEYLAHLADGVRRFDASDPGEFTPFIGGYYPVTTQSLAARQSNGNLIVAKTVKNADRDFRIYLQRFSAEGTLLGPSLPLTPLTQGISQGSATIHVADNDEYIVAWASSTTQGEGYAIHAQRFAADGTPIGNLIEVATGEPGFSGLDFAGDAAGNFTVVWSDYLYSPSRETRTFVRRFNDDGVPLTGITQLWTVHGSDPQRPSIAMDDSGRSIITWKDNTDVYVQAFDAQGAPIIEPFVINSVPAPTNLPYAPVEMNSKGEAIIAWWAQGGLCLRRLSLGEFPVLDLNGAAEGIDFAAETGPSDPPVAIVDPLGLTIDTASPTLVGATIEIEPSLSDGVLAIDTSGTAISATYYFDSITLSGVDSVANYQQVLRTLTYASPNSIGGGETVEIQLTIDDGAATSPIATARVRNTAPAFVFDRFLYYKGSSYDQELGNGYNRAYDVRKRGYQAGTGPATFENISSYSRGINGIVIHSFGDYGVPTVDDFTFKIGTSADPSTWVDAPAPSAITFRDRPSVRGLDLIEITWPDGAIQNTWLQVTMLANANTGLAVDDVFYFGSRIGDTGLGNSAAAAITSAADEVATRNHPAFGVDIGNVYDFNRDGLVSAADQVIARNNTGFLPMLNLLPATPQANAAAPLTAPSTSNLASSNLAPSAEVTHRQAIAFALVAPEATWNAPTAGPPQARLDVPSESKPLAKDHVRNRALEIVFTEADAESLVSGVDEFSDESDSLTDSSLLEL